MTIRGPSSTVTPYRFSRAAEIFATLNCFCISAISNLCNSTVPTGASVPRRQVAEPGVRSDQPLRPGILWRDGGIVLNDSNVWAKLTQCPPNPRSITVNIQGKDVKRQEDAVLAQNERRRFYVRNSWPTISCFSLI